MHVYYYISYIRSMAFTAGLNSGGATVEGGGQAMKTVMVIMVHFHK